MPPVTPKVAATLIRTYHESLAAVERAGARNEGATRAAFQTLLEAWAKPAALTVLAEQTLDGTRNRPIRVDGQLLNELRLTHGIWEAKDTGDDLEREISKKIAAGYPLRNTLFENTRRAVLYQDGRRVDFEADLLDRFIGYSPAQIVEFRRALVRF